MKKKIYAQDFQDVFNIPYLSHNIIEAKELLTWDLTKDKEYLTNPALNNSLEKKYGKQLEDGHTAPMYIKWVNKVVEYGVFAEKDIKKGDMICEYTGILCVDTPEIDNAYLWDYPTIMMEEIAGKKRRKRKGFCIDAGRGGNYARAINHTQRVYQNVTTQILPSQGLWHIAYIAQKDIQKDQQLLTHYGIGYWRDRQIVPKPLKP